MESKTATGVRATVEDILDYMVSKAGYVCSDIKLTGDGENVGLLGAGQVGDVCVEGYTLLGGCGLCDGHGDTENGVGTELLLVLGSIELVQERVNGGLVLDIDGLLDQSRGNDVVDVADSLGDTLAAPLGLVSIAELASLV